MYNNNNNAIHDRSKRKQEEPTTWKLADCIIFIEIRRQWRYNNNNNNSQNRMSATVKNQVIEDDYPK